MAIFNKKFLITFKKILKQQTSSFKTNNMQEFEIVQSSTFSDKSDFLQYLLHSTRPILLLDQKLQTDDEIVTNERKKKYFPTEIDGVEYNLDLIQFGPKSIYSTAYREDGQYTANILSQLASSLRSEPTILDACSNIGGNTQWFAREFSGGVLACERDSHDFQRLKNNLRLVYQLSNIEYYNGSCMDIINNQLRSFNVIFFDPEWGGDHYKKVQKLILAIDGQDISQIIDFCIQQNKADIIALKHPKNAWIQTQSRRSHTFTFYSTQSNGFKKMYYNLTLFVHPQVFYRLRSDLERLPKWIEV
jgi:hypothetical protein